MESIPMYEIQYERTFAGEIVLGMATILGYAIGVWLIYALLALAFKHKAGWIMASILCIFSGIAEISLYANYLFLISGVSAIFFIYFIVPLQIRSKKKEQWKQRHRENKNQRK